MRLTPRDFKVLTDLCANKVMSFEELRFYTFNDRHKSTVCNRLGKLEQMQMIRKIPVGNFIYKKNMRQVGIVFQITKKGIEVLKSENLFDQKWKSDPMTLNIQSLVHDLEVNHVVRFLMSELPNSKLLNGKHLSLEGRGDIHKVPDAMLTIDKNDLEKAKVLKLVAPDSILKNEQGLSMAIELEFTAKSDRRYREIVTFYRISREVDRFCIFQTTKIFLRRFRTYLRVYILRGISLPHSGSFSFVKLAEFYKPRVPTELNAESKNILGNEQNQTSEVFV